MPHFELWVREIPVMTVAYFLPALHYNVGRNPIMLLTSVGGGEYDPPTHICLSFMYSLHFGTPGTFLNVSIGGIPPPSFISNFMFALHLRTQSFSIHVKLRSLAVEQGKSLQLKICGIAPGCCRFCLDVLHFGNMSNYQQKLLYWFY